MGDSKEKYLTEENLDAGIQDILKVVRASGGRDRDFQIQGNPALLVTDMQEYFLSPASHAFIPSANAILPNILRLIGHFTEKNHPILFTQHSNDETTAGNMKTWWRDMITPSSPLFSLSPLLPIAQSINRPIAQSSLPPFHLSASPLILNKTQYDAFHQTGLENILRQNDIQTLIICGVMTNLCCETTLRAAFVKGFNAMMPVDATATYKKEFHTSTFINLSFGFCPVKTTSEILELLQR